MTGPQGLTGAPGSGEAALFYAQMPADNPLPISPGAEITFPNDGPSTTTNITRFNAYDFELGVSGTYRVTYEVPIDQFGQLVLSKQGVVLPYTTSGRVSAYSLIGLTTLVHASAGELITVRASPTNLGVIVVTQDVVGSQTFATLLIELVKAD